MIEGKASVLLISLHSVLLGRMKTLILTQLGVFYAWPSHVVCRVGKDNRPLNQIDTSLNPSSVTLN